ncbi:MAG: AraC family transcriptional regulator [Prevotellaceae bacterium]|jgi:AraC-like DNA-binding protein|nr:AraC family transcriptional regulator [Prevotellaceae bacterium]
MDTDKDIRYLVASELDLQWGLTVCSIGFQDINPSEAYPPQHHPKAYLFTPKRGRVLDEYQLIYITRGKGKFCSANHRSVAVKEGMMFLLFPGEWHTYYPSERTGWSEYFIGCRGYTMDQRMAKGFLQKSKPVFQVGLDEEVVRLYHKAMEVARKQRPGFQQMLSGIVNMLIGIAYSKDKAMSFQDKKVQQQIDKARIIMLEHVCKKITPEMIADQLGMSYSCFRKTFKEYTGFAPIQYIQELKLQYAKELLWTTQLTIKEIAFMLNFDNAEYFSVFFKKKQLLTPLEYRSYSKGLGNVPSPYAIEEEEVEEEVEE